MRTMINARSSVLFFCTKRRLLAMLDRHLRNGKRVERPTPTLGKLSVDMREWYGGHRS